MTTPHKQIRILHFTNTVVRGGVEEHILTLLRGLDRSRFSLALVCPPELAGQFGADIPADVYLEALKLDHLTQGGSALRFAKILRTWRPDVVHAHMFCSSLYAAPVSYFAGSAAFIETTHVRESWRRGWKRHYFVDRLISSMIDCYVAVSEANGRYLIEQKRIAPRKVRVIQNGCDVSRFVAEALSREALCHQTGIDAGKRLLVVGARLEPQKGHRYLLDAFSNVRSRNANVHLVCVGDGSLRRNLIKQAQSLGLSDSVTFAGYQSNMPDWLKMADIVVLPSLYEGLPLVAIEALAARRPLVATAVDGTAEVVVNEKTGLLVQPANSDELSSALCRLLEDKRLGDRLAEAGHAWVCEHFTQQHQLQKTADLYSSLAGVQQPTLKNYRTAELKATH